MHEPGVGGMGDRLRLHGGVDHHPLEILAFQRPGLVGDRKALLQERLDLRLTQALAPARH